MITLHTEERPTAVVTRNGGSTKLADDNFYTETYENGVYTLTITHNGQVNVTIRKGSAEPTPTVTEFKLVTDPEALTSAGGKAMLTLTGTNLPDGTKFYWGTDQAMLTPVDAEGSDASRSVEVKLPENTGTDAVTYYFRYSLDGTTLAGELTATVPGTGGGTQPTEPSVTDYSVAAHGASLQRRHDHGHAHRHEPAKWHSDQGWHDHCADEWRSSGANGNPDSAC